MKIILTTLLCFTYSFCQTAKQSFSALNPNIGVSAGTYANAGTDNLELDGFFEIQFINGHIVMFGLAIWIWIRKHLLNSIYHWAG